MAGNQSSYARRIYLWVFMRFRRGGGRKTEVGCTRVLQSGQFSCLPWDGLCEWSFCLFLLGLLPIWIYITFRPRCLKPRSKNGKSWTRLEFGWYASIWIDRLQHSLVNRQQSRKTCTLFDSYSMLLYSFYLLVTVLFEMPKSGTRNLNIIQLWVQLFLLFRCFSPVRLVWCPSLCIFSTPTDCCQVPRWNFQWSLYANRSEQGKLKDVFDLSGVL